MAEQRPTPEEQLLKLIEKEDDGTTARFKRKRNIFLGFSDFWFSLIKKISQGLARLKDGLREPNLRVLNKFFLVVSILLLGYSVADFVFSRPDINRVYKKSRLVKEKVTQEKLISERRPFLHYLEMVWRRNIFSPITLDEAENPEVQKKQLQEMVNDLGLVGISWGEEHVAMIEDKKAQKTYFLKKGDKINNLKIENILKEKVILSFEGKEIELI